MLIRRWTKVHPQKKKVRATSRLYDLTWTTVTMSSHNSIIGRYNCTCTARRTFCTSLGIGCLRRQNGHPWLWVEFYFSKAVKIHRVALPTSQCPRQQWKAAWKAQTIDKIQLPVQPVLILLACLYFHLKDDGLIDNRKLQNSCRFFFNLTLQSS